MTREEQRTELLVYRIKDNCYEVAKKLLKEHDKQVRAEIIAEISREMRLLYGNEYEQQIRADIIEECNRKLDELERNYKSCYGVEIIEMYTEVYEDFRTWLKEQK